MRLLRVVLATCLISTVAAAGELSWPELVPPPEFEVIYVRDDATVADMETFAKETGFSWRAVTMDTTDDLPVFSRAFGAGLPQVLVMDRSGKVLADGAGTTSAPAALKQLRALLEKPSARN